MTGLEITGLRSRYGTGRSAVTAVDGVDLHIPPGKVVGLVGESGSGKSTLARAIIGLAPVTDGTITLDGESLVGRSAATARRRRAAQLVFQDPYDSLDARMSVRESLTEGLRAGPDYSRARRSAQVAELLTMVGLEPAAGNDRPGRLSGGQRQRVAIARALAAEPHLLIADEITSALDVSVQGSVLNLVRTLQRQRGFGMLFISHNLAIVRYVADVIAVMYCGKIIEMGPALDVAASPRHPYTQALLAAARPQRPEEHSDTELLLAEPADPRDPPSGCRFHPRCPRGPRTHPEHAVCRTADPGGDAAASPHRVACFYPQHAG